MIRLTVFLAAIVVFVTSTYGASPRETDCQRRRRQEQHATQNLTGLMVPVCDEDGQYLALQCFGQSVHGPPFCACYDNDFVQIKGPSRNLKSCNCIRQHHEWEHSDDRSRSSAPRCNSTSGEYYPVQCDEHNHWCVDTDTGVKHGAEREGGCDTNLSTVTCHRLGSPHEGSSQTLSNHDLGHHAGGTSSHKSGPSETSGSGHHDAHSDPGH